MRLPGHHQPLHTTRGPRRKEEFALGLRAGRSWPIAHHGCANHASIHDAALQAGTWPGLRCVEPWTHAGPEPGAGRMARPPGTRGQRRDGRRYMLAVAEQGWCYSYRNLDVTCQQWSLSLSTTVTTCGTRVHSRRDGAASRLRLLQD
jgi:hypothetical protein